MIHPPTVTSVLLADGWHEVANQDKGTGFEVVQDYFFVGGEELKASWFLLAEAGETETLIAGPLSAVQAIKYRSQPTR